MRIRSIFSLRKWIRLFLEQHALSDRLSDRAYIKLEYYSRMGKRLRLERPVTFCEKLQWMKLYDRNPMFIRMVDKNEAKAYISEMIGDQYVIPSIGVWDSFDDIEFDKLPERFVLKCTHDSGGIVICKDKRHFDMEEARARINASLKRNYFFSGREWPYKYVKPRVIAEEYLEDAKCGELRDYKFFAFDGIPKLMFVASERQSKAETKFDFFDMDFHFVDMRNGHPNAEIRPECPQNFELMKELTKKISKGFPHLRVDFYEVNGRVYLGELTLYHWSGMMPFDPPEWDKKLGEWIRLPNVN